MVYPLPAGATLRCPRVRSVGTPSCSSSLLRHSVFSVRYSISARPSRRADPPSQRGWETSDGSSQGLFLDWGRSFLRVHPLDGRAAVSGQRCQVDCLALPALPGDRDAARELLGRARRVVAATLTAELTQEPRRQPDATVHKLVTPSGKGRQGLPELQRTGMRQLRPGGCCAAPACRWLSCVRRPPDCPHMLGAAQIAQLANCAILLARDLAAQTAPLRSHQATPECLSPLPRIRE